MSNPEVTRIEALLERIAIALERIVNSRSSSETPVFVRQATGMAIRPMNNSEDISTTSFSDVNHASLKCESIVAFLEAKGIRVKTIPPTTPADEIIDSLSLLLGSRYTSIEKILNHIKRNMQIGGSFQLFLRDEAEEAISSICQFCQRLYQVSFLTDYRYEKSPKYILHATVSSTPTAQRFFSGQWLERFILVTIKNAIKLTAPDIQFEWLINPQIILPNGDDFELDVIVWVAEKLFWIEAKTGDFQQYIDKYSRMAKLLKLPPDQTFMVLTRQSQENCHALSSLFNITVCDVTHFTDVIQEAFAKRVVRFFVEDTSSSYLLL